MNQELTTNYLQKTVDLKTTIEQSFLLLGERLKKIRDEGMFRPTYSFFYEWLEAEAKMKESMASRLISVYEKFIVNWGIDPTKVAEAGGWSDVYSIGTFAKTKEEAESWLERKKTLSSGDFRKEVTESKHGKCEHEWVEVHLNQCTKCGDREKIFHETDL